MQYLQTLWSSVWWPSWAAGSSPPPVVEVVAADVVPPAQIPGPVVPSPKRKRRVRKSKAPIDCDDSDLATGDIDVDMRARHWKKRKHFAQKKHTRNAPKPAVKKRFQLSEHQQRYRGTPHPRARAVESNDRYTPRAAEKDLIRA